MDKDKLNAIIEKEGNEFEFKAYGLDCCIKRIKTLGHLCGYVKVPQTSRLFGKDYYNFDIDVEGVEGETNCIAISGVEKAINNIEVHGGLTYAGDIKADGNWWFGFDCAHLRDLLPYGSLGYLGVDSTYKTKEFVIEECTSLARQLVDIIEKYEGRGGRE